MEKSKMFYRLGLFWNISVLVWLFLYCLIANKPLEDYHLILILPGSISTSLYLYFGCKEDKVKFQKYHEMRDKIILDKTLNNLPQTGTKEWFVYREECSKVNDYQICQDWLVALFEESTKKRNSIRSLILIEPKKEE